MYDVKNHVGQKGVRKVMSGYIHIYCGNGKGKTTAAIGLSIRSAGAGIPVVFTQFMKDGTSSEIPVLKNISNLSVYYAKENFGFSWTLTEEEKQIAKSVYTGLFLNAVQCLVEISKKENKEELAEKEQHLTAVLILDEVISAYNYDMINREVVLKWLQKKPDGVEVVLTGRDPRPELLELASYVTEMKNKAHVYESGIQARKGIEK